LKHGGPALLASRVGFVRLAFFQLFQREVAKFVAGIRVAGQARIHLEAACKPVRLVTNVLGVKSGGSEEELFRSGGRRHEHLVKVGHRTVVQERRGGPDAVVGPCPIPQIGLDDPVLSTSFDHGLLFTKVELRGHRAIAVPFHPG
jgi:hypothetical protein